MEREPLFILHLLCLNSATNQPAENNHGVKRRHIWQCTFPGCSSSENCFAISIGFVVFHADHRCKQMNKWYNCTWYIGSFGGGFDGVIKYSEDEICNISIRSRCPCRQDTCCKQCSTSLTKLFYQDSAMEVPSVKVSFLSRLMTADDRWWQRMSADDSWWRLRTADGSWWRLMTADNSWRQRMTAKFLSSAPTCSLPLHCSCPFSYMGTYPHLW